MEYQRPRFLPSPHRIKAIPSPCPCNALSPRNAALIASATGAALYLGWMGVLWKSYKGLTHVVTLPESAGAVQLSSMTSYAQFATWYSLTAAALWVATAITCAFPHREVIKNLSRVNWGTWALSWAVGVIGVVCHVSSDEFLEEHCKDDKSCWDYWRLVQFGIIADLFVTLLFVCWFNIVVTAWVHTLHPHIFYVDSDSEDERYTRWVDQRKREMGQEDSDSDDSWSEDEKDRYEELEDQMAQLRQRHSSRSAGSSSMLAVQSHSRSRTRGRSTSRVGGGSLTVVMEQDVRNEGRSRSRGPSRSRSRSRPRSRSRSRAGEDRVSLQQVGQGPVGYDSTTDEDEGDQAEESRSAPLLHSRGRSASRNRMA